MPQNDNRAINVILNELDARATTAETSPIVYFASATVSTTEGNTGTKTLTLTARRSGLAGALNVPATFVAGTADASDFPAGLPGNKTFAFVDGVDTATVDIAIKSDLDVESDETFGYQLQSGSGYRLGNPSSITGTILNDDTAQTPSAFTMTQLATPNRVYPRTTTTSGGASRGAGPIEVVLNVTQAGTIYARTRSTASDNPILQPSYLAVTNATVANGPVVIPNVDARPEEFFLDLSPDGTNWTNGTTPIGMGALAGYGGQSLMYNMFVRAIGSDTLAGVGETEGGSVYFDGAWRRIIEATNTSGAPVNGAGAAALVRLLSAQYGCRVGLVGHAISATSIDIWVPGGGAGWNGLSAAINATGNRLEAFYWLQGHSDAGVNKPGYTYRARLTALMAGIDGLVPSASFTRYVATIPNISTTQWGEPRDKYAIRIAGDRWCRDNSRAVSVVFDDIDQVDGVHPNQTGAKRQAVHFARASSPAGDQAYTAHTITKSGAVVTLNLTLAAGATALNAVGDLAGRIGVWQRGLASTVAKYATSGINIGAASSGIVPVAITLSADPGDKLLDIWIAPKNDPDSTGSTGILLDNSPPVAGTTFGRQVARARPFEMKARRDLVLADSPAYGAGMFGQQALTAGYGSNPDRLIPHRSAGMTLEFWIKHPGASGNQVWAHAGGRYLGCNGTGLLTNAGTSAAGVVPANQWLHVAWTFDNRSSLVHINGALVATLAEEPNNTDEPIGIRAFYYGDARSAATTAICQVALFDQAMRTPDAFTPPAGAYTGGEARLLHLWPLDGNGNDAVIR